jgi:hypothetical protein
MSSVEPLKVEEVAPATTRAIKKTVRFNDGVNAEKCNVRKPLQVLNLASSRDLADSLPDYFFPVDIGTRSTLKDEVSAVIELSQKFSHNTDVCIVFSRVDLPLSIFPEINPNLEKISNPNLKIIQIEVRRGRDFEDYARETIKAIRTAYTKVGESSEIENLKNQLAERAESMLLPKASEVQRRIALYDLIKLYAAIDTCPEVILGHYNDYQRNVSQIDQDFKTKRTAIFTKTCRDLSDIEKREQEISKLKAGVPEAKKEELEGLIESIKRHYPSRLLDAPDHDVKEQTVEAEITVAMSSASQSAVMSNEVSKKQPSGSDAGIQSHLQEMKKHTFFRTVPVGENEKKDVNKMMEKKDVNKMMEKKDSLSSALFQSALVKGDKVKKEVEQMMETVGPIYSSP